MQLTEDNKESFHFVAFREVSSRLPKAYNDTEWFAIDHHSGGMVPSLHTHDASRDWTPSLGPKPFRSRRKRDICNRLSEGNRTWSPSNYQPGIRKTLRHISGISSIFLLFLQPYSISAPTTGSAGGSKG